MATTRQRSDRDAASAWYDGISPLRHLWTSMASLYVIFFETDNQWTLRRTREMWPNFWASETIQAATFWTDWSRFIWALLTPNTDCYSSLTTTDECMYQSHETVNCECCCNWKNPDRQMESTWRSRISWELFDLESPNFSGTFIPVGSTTTLDMTSLSTSGWQLLQFKKWSRMPPTTVSGGISGERFKPGS